MADGRGDGLGGSGGGGRSGGSRYGGAGANRGGNGNSASSIGNNGVRPSEQGLMSNYPRDNSLSFNPSGIFSSLMNPIPGSTLSALSNSVSQGPATAEDLAAMSEADRSAYGAAMAAHNGANNMGQTGDGSGGGVAGTGGVGGGVTGVGGVGGGVSGNPNAASVFSTNNGLFSSDFSQGDDGQYNLTNNITDPRLQEISDNGLTGAAKFFNEAMNSQNAATAGRMGNDFLNQIGSTDPMEVAQRQFDLMNPLLREQQQQDLYGLESRLFSQGQMGSGGFAPGQHSMNAMFDANNDSRQKLLFDSLNQGMQTQNHVANMGSSLSQLDPQLRQQYQNLGQGMFNVPMSIQQQMLNQANVTGGLAGAANSADISQQQVNAYNNANEDPSLGSSIVDGIFTKGVDYLSDKLFK
jgi:hypothetical protein